MSRGVLQWRITVTADGRPPLDGALPALIEWCGALHPCDVLDPRGCELVELRIAHPRAAHVRSRLAQLALSAPCTVREGELDLTARVRTPRGDVELR